MSFADRTGEGAGYGAGRLVVEAADTAVDEATAWIFFSERVEYMAAVTAAPVPALTAAIIAKVDFDILAEGTQSRETGPVLCMEFGE